MAPGILLFFALLFICSENKESAKKNASEITVKVEFESIKIKVFLQENKIS